MRCALFSPWLRISILLALAAWPAGAQISGVPLIKPYPRQVYGGRLGHVFAVAQDSRGLLYFTDPDVGLLIFDGERWRTVGVDGSLEALAIDEQDRVWLAGPNHLGFFAADAIGELSWHEMSGMLPEDRRTFSRVWPIISTHDGLFFLAREFLFRYQDGHFDSWPGSADKFFYRGYEVAGRRFFARYGVGLLELNDQDALVELGHGELAGTVEINAMFELDDGTPLLVTRQHGAFYLKPDGIEAAPAPSDAWLRENQVQHGCSLPDGRFALATRRGGIGIFDQELHLERVIDQNVGLTHDSVSFLFVDQQKNLWAATHNGVNRILLDTAITGIGHTSGLPEMSIYSIGEHHGELLVGTALGAYRGFRERGEHATDVRFTPVPEIESQTWDFLPLEDEVLIATTDGVFEARFRSAGELSLSAVTLLRSGGSLSLLQSPEDPELVFVGMAGGIGRLRKMDGQWRWQGRLEGLHHAVWQLELGPDGEILARLPSVDQIAILSFPQGLEVQPELLVEQVDSKFNLARLDDDLVLFDGEGRLLRYEGLAAARAGKGFAVDPSLTSLASKISGNILLDDDENRLWVPTSRGLRLAHWHGNSEAGDSEAGDSEAGYPKVSTAGRGELELEPVTDQILDPPTCVLEDTELEDTFWLGTVDGLVRVIPNHDIEPRHPPSTLIRRVVELPTGRLLEAGGSRNSAAPSPSGTSSREPSSPTAPSGESRAEPPVLEYQNGSLRFEFASPTFDQNLDLLYRVRLEGFQNTWTAWSPEAFKEYTSLSEGNYVFNVQTQDAWGNLGEPAAWAFRISPPWFRAGWAVAGYFLSAVGLLLLTVRLRTHRLEVSQLRLEQLIAQRTEELAEGKHQVEQQATDLERVNRLLAEENEHRRQLERERAKLQQRAEQSQKLESLGMMAGGIAHDFNNILMAILGNADLCLDEAKLTASLERRLQAIGEAGRRAAELCQQMLAYAGKGEIEERELDLSTLAGETLEMLRVSIDPGTVIETDLAGELPAVLGDETKIRQLMMNLLRNAAEAIGHQAGHLRLVTGVRHLDSEAQGSLVLADPIPEGPYVFARVEDDGEGMDVETRRRIFDPFFTTKFAGRGLGLAATLGILRSHGGAISVNSQLGQGTKIEVFFPALDHQVNEVQVRTPEATRTWRQAGTILVVDDEAIVRDVVSLMLQNTGFDVLSAASGQEALEIFGRERSTISAVILDYSMPGLDGSATFERLKMLDPEVKAVLSSGYSGDTLIDRFLEQGFAAFIAKPYKVTTLRETLRQILG